MYYVNHIHNHEKCLRYIWSSKVCSVSTLIDVYRLFSIYLHVQVIFIVDKYMLVYTYSALQFVQHIFTVSYNHIDNL